MSKNTIKFHKENEKWGEFSNYYPTKIKVQIPILLNTNGEVVSEKGYLPLGELEFSTSEALFHALKFTQEGNVKPEIINQIKNLDPDSSKKLAKSHDKSGYNTEKWWFNGWNNKAGGYCIRAMKWVIREKFKQNSTLLEKLLETGDAELVENTQIAKSYNDEFWGNGWSGNGSNWLGKILMDIRKEIVEKSRTPPKPRPEKPKPTPLQTCTFCFKPIDSSIIEVISDNKKYCSNECLIKQKEKDNPQESEREKPDTPPTNEKPDQLSQTHDQAFTDITSILNQNPQITDSELDYYQNWKEILKGFTDLDKIKNFKNDIIVHIKTKRKTKLEAEKVKNEIKSAQGKSGEELRKNLENLKKNESDKSHQEHQKTIEELSKKSAQEDPKNYQKMAVKVIKENLESNQIEENEMEKIPELKDDWKKLKEGEKTNPEEIINIEKKITKKTNEIGAQKRFDKMVETANQALKLGEKEQLKKVIEEIIKFISSSNIYDQEILSQKKETINQLKSELENYSISNSPNLPTKSPWKIIVPIFLLAGIGALVIIIINIRKKKLKEKIQWRKAKKNVSRNLQV